MGGGSGLQGRVPKGSPLAVGALTQGWRCLGLGISFRDNLFRHQTHMLTESVQQPRASCYTNTEIKVQTGCMVDQLVDCGVRVR